MIEMSVKEMLEAGAHFGHQTHRWDPRMKPYIYGARNGIHIINLEKTVRMYAIACEVIEKTIAEGGDVLFVGTKRQAQGIIEQEAKRCQMYFVNQRWLGGTLTNFRTIRSSIERLQELEKKRDEGGLEGLTKKEKLGVEREIIKLTKAFGGIKGMSRLPSALFVIDPHTESIALLEARRLKIPVIALADTNCNPEGIDYLIPANDDAIKSINLFTSRVAQACLDGLARRDSVLRGRISKEGESSKPLSREAVGAKGKAYVSKPEAYEEPVNGEFRAGEGEPAEKP